MDVFLCPKCLGNGFYLIHYNDGTDAGVRRCRRCKRFVSKTAAEDYVLKMQSAGKLGQLTVRVEVLSEAPRNSSEGLER